MPALGVTRSGTKERGSSKTIQVAFPQELAPKSGFVFVYRRFQAFQVVQQFMEMQKIES